MSDADRFPLLHGPYTPPGCQVGDTLTCALRDNVTVIDFTRGPIR